MVVVEVVVDGETEVRSAEETERWWMMGTACGWTPTAGEEANRNRERAWFGNSSTAVSATWAPGPLRRRTSTEAVTSCNCCLWASELQFPIADGFSAGTLEYH